MQNFILLQYIDSLVDQKLLKWKIRKVMEMVSNTHVRL